MSSKVAHYATLIVAENPVEYHKEYMEQLEEEEETQILETERLQSIVMASDCSSQIAAEAQELEEQLRQINISR